jgi:CRP-like cAMP-binding protein
MSVQHIATSALELNSRFLRGIDPSSVNVVAGSATPRRFPAKSVVTNQGSPANHFFLLVKGRARHFFMTDDGEKLLLLWLTPGDVFGGRALLPTPSSYLVSTEVIKDSYVLVWERPTIRGLVSRYPRLLENGLAIADDYLVWYTADHVALTTDHGDQRLARVLTYLAELIGQKGPEGFEFDATNEELASAANITPFTASRLLSKWQRSGAVVKRRGKIILRSPESLIRLSA